MKAWKIIRDLEIVNYVTGPRNSQIIIVFATSLVFLIGLLSFHNVYADFFLDFPIRLHHSPLICAMEPQPDTQFPGVGMKMLERTNYAVIDWNNKLNQGNSKHPLWNLTLIQVPLGKQSTFDSSTCDIIMEYFRKPSNPQLEFVATGITIPNFEEGKTRIEIYYLGIQELSKYEQWTVGDTTYYTYIPTPSYTGYLAPDPQLDGAIEHEIGHSLGLGHYIVPNEELQRAVQGTEDMPSIMIPIQTAIGVNHFDITPLDLGEIKSIYGFGGIGSQTPINQYNKVGVISTDKITYLPQDTVTVKLDTSNFDDNETADLMVLDPSNKMIQIYSVSKDNATFSFSNERQTGKYYVELLDSYSDKYDFASFNVANHSASVPSPQTTPITSPSDQSTPVIAASIPSWIKTNAKWWSQGQVGDDDFVKGIQYLIQQGTLKIPSTAQANQGSHQIPLWVKSTAGWWASGQVSDDEFVKAIQFLISAGIINA